MSSTILVTGATGSHGNQGGTTARALLAQGAKVHVLARNPDSEAARALAALGAVIFKGDLYEPATIAKAAEGCDGAFINVTPSFTDPQGEFKAAQNVLDAAKATGVKHVIYTSVLGTGKELKPAPEPGSWMENYWASKNGIEATVVNSGIEKWTLLRPGTFMTNYILPSSEWMYPELSKEGVFLTAFDPDTPAALVDPNDVGPFAAAAFADPAKFHGQKIEIAVEIATPPGIAKAISKVTGRNVEAKFHSVETVEQLKNVNPFLDSQLYLNSLGGSSTDLDEVKRWGVGLRGFEEFLEKHKDKIFKA